MRQSINILAIFSISLVALTTTRGGGVVVRKKIKIAKDRDDSAGDSAREGRHLGLFTPLAELYLRLQCSPYQCQTNPSTANICCARNFNLNCCLYNAGALAGPLYSAVARPTIWRPPAPFSLGLSVQLSQSEPTLEDVPHYHPPEDNHHHHHQHHHHQQHQY